MFLNILTNSVNLFCYAYNVKYAKVVLCFLPSTVFFFVFVFHIHGWVDEQKKNVSSMVISCKNVLCKNYIINGNGKYVQINAQR